MADTERIAPKYHNVLFGALSVPGVILGAVLLAFSFGPSLLPREPMMQGVLGALFFTSGYALGVLVWSLVRWVAKLMEEPIQKDSGPTWPSGWSAADTNQLERHFAPLDLPGL
jgi:uncharacterized membrane protein